MVIDLSEELEENDEEADSSLAVTVVRMRKKWNPLEEVTCRMRKPHTENLEIQGTKEPADELKHEASDEDKEETKKSCNLCIKSNPSSMKEENKISDRNVIADISGMQNGQGMIQARLDDCKLQAAKIELLSHDEKLESEDSERSDCEQTESPSHCTNASVPCQPMADVLRDTAKEEPVEQATRMDHQDATCVEEGSRRTKWTSASVCKNSKLFDLGHALDYGEGCIFDIDEEGEAEEEGTDLEECEEEFLIDVESDSGYSSRYEYESEVKKFFQAIVQRDSSTVERILSNKRCYIFTEDFLRRNPLQAAVLKGYHDILEILLSSLSHFQRRATVYTLGKTLPEKGGESLLHLALSVSRFEETRHDALECIKSLIGAKAKLNALNAMGRSPLHLACMQGDCHAVDALLTHQADPGIHDTIQNYPLHYAIDSQSSRCIELMLVASDPKLFIGKDHLLYRIIESQSWEAVFLMDKKAWPMEALDMPTFADYAQARGLGKQWEFVQIRRGDFVGLQATASFDDFQWPSDIFAPTFTALVTHESCIRHGALPHDIDDLFLRQETIERIYENPHRLEILCGKFGILRSSMFKALRWHVDPPPAPMVDLLRVHEYAYIYKFQRMLQKTASAAPTIARKSHIDVYTSKDTWEAARRACGCVLQAVDLVMEGSVRNAFCAVRPPGHHLGPQGAVDKQLNDHEVLEGSQGFCVLNNVAVGAAYALSNYRKSVRKVAILDFDVHHGNGTEAIVRNVMEKRWRSQILKSKSVEVGDANSTRDDEDAGALKMKLPPTMSCKPWLDPSSDCENIFFASVHGYDKDNSFYPGSGQSCSQSSPRVINVALAPGSDSHEWRRALKREVLPALTTFAPDLIFISAGFDAHADDPVGNCGLTDDDYVWVTRSLVSIANQCCQGRLVSTLEGGYNTLAENLSPLALSVAGHVRTLISTPLDYRRRLRRETSTKLLAPARTLKRSESSDNVSTAKRLKLAVSARTREAKPLEIASGEQLELSPDAAVLTLPIVENQPVSASSIQLEPSPDTTQPAPPEQLPASRAVSHRAVWHVVAIGNHVVLIDPR